MFLRDLETNMIYKIIIINNNNSHNFCISFEINHIYNNNKKIMQTL